MRHHLTTSRRTSGMTLIELLITVVVIGIVIVAVAPNIASEEPLRLVAAGTVLVADVEYAQSATLSSPSDPTIVRFSDEGDAYWLALASAPEAPINRPGSEKPYEVVFGQGDARVLEGVTADASGTTDATIAFDAFGRLSTLSNAIVVLNGPAGTVQITVTATTGSVHLVSGTIADAGGDSGLLGEEGDSEKN